MKTMTVAKTLAVVAALLALSAVGCRCCDDYPSRSYRYEPPPGVGPQSSLTSNPVGHG
jgi:hypothetical protein